MAKIYDLTPVALVNSVVVPHIPSLRITAADDLDTFTHPIILSALSYFSGVRDGDTLLVTRIDRLARDTRDLLNIIHEIKLQGATLRSLAEPVLDTSSDFAEAVVALASSPNSNARASSRALLKAVLVPKRLASHWAANGRLQSISGVRFAGVIEPKKPTFHS